MIWPPEYESRYTVIWRAGQLSGRQELAFTRLGLQAHGPTTKADITAMLPTAASLILPFGGENRLRRWLRSYGPLSKDHDVLIIVLVADVGQANEVSEVVAVEGIEVETELSSEPELIAGMVARHRPRASMGSTRINSHKPIKDKSRLILLRRAFSGFDSVELHPLTGGRSGAAVFRAEAGQVAGPTPVPFVVKIDRKGEIIEEYNRYRNYVQDYIPFHLRPNIDPGRSFPGAQQAIMVATFLETCHPLLQSLPTGNAEGVVHSLFEHTLASWRTQGYREGNPETRNLFDENDSEDGFDLGVDIAQQHSLATENGLTSQPGDLLRLLWDQPALKHRRAMMHGDLNVHNVFVRGHEAVVIDFRWVRQGPLAADPASLEVSFLTEFPSKGAEKLLPFADWKAMVDRLYEPDYLFSPPPPQTSRGLSRCVEACVRRLRLIAASSAVSQAEYPFCLAYYLLRRGRRALPGEPGLRRAYCLVLAERVLKAITDI